MYSLGFSVNLAPLYTALNKIGDPVRKDYVVRNMLQAVAEDTKTSIMRKTPVKTGRLRSSWELHVIHLPGVSMALISNRVSYSAAVEEGTVPHIIRPRNRMVLHWSSAFIGPLRRGVSRNSMAVGHFARVVHHPGTRGAHMVQNTITRDFPGIVRKASRFVRDIYLRPSPGLI